MCGCDQRRPEPVRADPVAVAAPERVTSPSTDEVSLAGYPDWIRQYLKTRKWKPHNSSRKLHRKMLLESIDLGIQFLIRNQKAEGNFNYEYDWIERKQSTEDHPVRQAGTLWGLGFAYRFRPDPVVKVALDKGLGFFFALTRPGPEAGTLTIAYPGSTSVGTGTVALVALAIVEYLRADKEGEILPDAYRRQLTRHLDGYLKMLVWLQLENWHFSRSYSLLDQTRQTRHSSYFDGETLLCLVKAAKYLDRRELIGVIEPTAKVFAQEYTVDAWRKDRDSLRTKGFFQWGCMAFWEYQDAGYDGARVFGDCLLSLAWWMIHTHRTLSRPKGTGYAHEGLAHAYQLALKRNPAAAAADIGYTIDRAMYRLTSWQVGGPLAHENEFLREHPTEDPLAVGGHLNHRSQPALRVDVTQHTLHAQILCLNYVYRD